MKQFKCLYILRAYLFKYIKEIKNLSNFFFLNDIATLYITNSILKVYVII